MYENLKNYLFNKHRIVIKLDFRNFNRQLSIYLFTFYNY